MKDGGQAFPSMGIETEIKYSGDRVEPHVYSYEEAKGMTLHQWYAGQALIGLIIRETQRGSTMDGTHQETIEMHSRCARQYADAMIK